MVSWQVTSTTTNTCTRWQFVSLSVSQSVTQSVGFSSVIPLSHLWVSGLGFEFEFGFGLGPSKYDSSLAFAVAVAVAASWTLIVPWALWGLLVITPARLLYATPSPGSSIDTVYRWWWRVQLVHWYCCGGRQMPTMPLGWMTKRRLTARVAYKVINIEQSLGKF